jgi:protein-S-isoprenylcysteine O-methyltransferase Ste14/predicted DCC family thiol-disulfide oxidoreductase YuxK
MFGSLPIREARPASAAWNVVKTLVLMVPLWAIAFFALPGLCYFLEGFLGLEGYRFASPFWQTVGAALFSLGSLQHLISNLVLAVYGEGTPLVFDCPRRLVIAGPYRHVRNPMAIAMLAQAVGVALFLGSPLALLYALVLVLVLDNAIACPLEDADLERRFGDAYRRYRLRVRSWRPRLRAYDPAREAEEPPVATERTRPPGRNVVLYDGLCRFCAAGAKQLAALARPGTVELVNFQDPGVLDEFPGISHDACMRQMVLVTADGRTFGGFEAAVRAVATRPVIGWIAYGYYLPGVRLLFDLLYALIAANRYRLMGKAVAAGHCDGTTCAVHFRPQS